MKTNMKRRKLKWSKKLREAGISKEKLKVKRRKKKLEEKESHPPNLPVRPGAHWRQHAVSLRHLPFRLVELHRVKVRLGHLEGPPHHVPALDYHVFRGHMNPGRARHLLTAPHLRDWRSSVARMGGCYFGRLLRFFGRHGYKFCKYLFWCITLV